MRALAHTTLRVRGGRPLCGHAELSVDIATTARVLTLAALATHDSRIDAPLRGHELASTVRVLRSLGARIELDERGTRIDGVGLRGLTAPSGALDVGQSPLAFAIGAGLLAGQRFGTRIVLETQGRDPAPAIASALRARGAMIAEGRLHSPGAPGSAQRTQTSLAIAPLIDGETLQAIEWTASLPDELTKTALLLSGLFTQNSTAFAEPLLSADHTERWLTGLSVPLRRMGSMSGFDPQAWSGRLELPAEPGHKPAKARELWLPGDTSQASFLAALASGIPDSEVVLHDVGHNHTRTGTLDALRLLGASIDVEPKSDGRGFEPVAQVHVRAGRARGGPIDAELLVRSRGSVGALIVLALGAQRGGSLHDPLLVAGLGEQPFARVASLLATFGAVARQDGSALHVEGASSLRPADASAAGNAELALLALGLALRADGESTLSDMPDLDEHWPGLLGVLTKLGAELEIAETTTTPLPVVPMEPQ